MKEKIVLIGGGGHCRVVIDAIKLSGDFEITGIVDPGMRMGEEVSGVKVIGDDSVLKTYLDQGGKKVFITVGSVGDSAPRKRLFEMAKEMGFAFPVVRHPSAVVARDVDLGEGTFIAASATINTGTRVGKNAIINTSASIDHDCEIGDHVHIGPGAILSGEVRVEGMIHIGTGASISNGVSLEWNNPQHRLIKAGLGAFVDSKGRTRVMTRAGDVGDKDA